MKSDITPYVVYENTSLVDSMKKINENSKCMLYVIDREEKLIGSLTDGDIRWWIVDKGELTAEVSQIANRGVKFIKWNEEIEPSVFMYKNQIHSVPVVNEAHQIIKIFFLDDRLSDVDLCCKNQLLQYPVVIMAGGKGTRLRPFTRILPKPLIPIQDVPILERIMNRFYAYGAKEYYITVNYRKEMIKSYFSDAGLPYQIEYVEEDKPLGTAGSLRLISREFKNPVIVTNCDTLIQEDYGKILDKHNAQGNDMTIVSAEKNTIIPYGVIHLDKGVISSMEEKPKITYMINTGMYILNPSFIKWIPTDKVYHMTDLADKLIKNKKKVGIYVIREDSFLDMGEFEEMKKMEERIGHGFRNG